MCVHGFTLWNSFTFLLEHVSHCRDDCVVEFDVRSRTVVTIVIDERGTLGELSTLNITGSLYR